MADPKDLAQALMGYGRDFAQGASNSIASNVSAPVDGLAWLLRKAGVPVPSNPMGGSDWMAEKGLTQQPQNRTAGLIGEFSGMAGPMVAAAKAPQLARGLLSLEDKALDMGRVAIENRMVNSGMIQSVAPRSNIQSNAAFVYPQDKALATAQINAAKSLDEGGLGLAANNTPAQRSQAMGFTDDAYHGTNRNFDSFENKMLGVKTGAKSAEKAHFSAANPALTESYVGLDHVRATNAPAYEELVKNKQAWSDFNNAPSEQARWEILERLGLNHSHGQVMPLQLNLGESRVKDYGGQGYRDVTFNDELKAAIKGKKDSVVFKNTFDPGPNQGPNVMSDIYAVRDPANIRSRFAAFDPARRNEADILGRASPGMLGAIAGGSLLGIGGYNALKDK